MMNMTRFTFEKINLTLLWRLIRIQSSIERIVGSLHKTWWWLRFSVAAVAKVKSRQNLDKIEMNW